MGRLSANLWGVFWSLKFVRTCNSNRTLTSSYELKNVFSYLLVLWLLVDVPWIVPSQWRRGSRAQRRSHLGQRCQSSESDLVESALQPSAPGSCRNGCQPHCYKTVPLAWLQEVLGLHKTAVDQNYHRPIVCVHTFCLTWCASHSDQAKVSNFQVVLTLTREENVGRLQVTMD